MPDSDFLSTDTKNSKIRFLRRPAVLQETLSKWHIKKTIVQTNPFRVLTITLSSI